MSEDRQGFEAEGKFHPFVDITDWLNKDFVLASRVTQRDTDDYLKDAALSRQAYAVVAMRHTWPARDPDELIEWFGNLKPRDIANVGFAEDADALPPASGNGSGGAPSESVPSSSPTSDARSAATPATSTTVSSGTPGAPTTRTGPSPPR